jgi:hypothetical protein
MDAKKVQEVIDTYRAKLTERGVRPIDYAHEEIVFLKESKLGHCLGMLSKMEEFLKENRMDKVFRWLGFVQGVLWSEGAYTLEELKNHNRP